eukprot:GEMP01031477.1.p1 GENE.GEMP01031477.1~~GEMP01031477.1.p1  ORF type:complete len:198 (+),score=28.14 GEMP01031477.1:216-809(+)
MAPQYQRSMCSYTQDFIPRPLAGCETTRESCKIFKEKCESVSHKAPSGALQKDTTSSRSFSAISSEAAAKAVMAPFVPISNLTVNPGQLMVVTKSNTHQSYSCPSPDMMKQSRGETFKPRILAKRIAIPFISSSSYNLEFRASKYGWNNTSAFGTHSSARNVAPPTTGYTGKQRASGAHALDADDFCMGDMLAYSHL